MSAPFEERVIAVQEEPNFQLFILHARCLPWNASP